MSQFPGPVTFIAKGICGCDYINDLEVGDSPGLSKRVKCDLKVLIRRRQRDQRGSRRCENEGKTLE